jgi:hypothetical protein
MIIAFYFNVNTHTHTHVYINYIFKSLKNCLLIKIFSIYNSPIIHILIAVSISLLSYKT